MPVAASALALDNQAPLKVRLLKKVSWREERRGKWFKFFSLGGKPWDTPHFFPLRQNCPREYLIFFYIPRIQNKTFEPGHRKTKIQCLNTQNNPKAQYLSSHRRASSNINHSKAFSHQALTRSCKDRAAIKFRRRGKILRWGRKLVTRATKLV